MDDFSFWWYIIAAVIYFLTRGKKKKPQQSRPGSENNPPGENRPKSFEDLLKEITEGRLEDEQPPPKVEQRPLVVKEPIEREEVKDRKLVRERRVFADDESKRVYEESIKMAEGADLAFEPDENYKQPRLFATEEAEDDEPTIADEIRDGLDTSEAKKAVIYAEILNRKY